MFLFLLVLAVGSFHDAECDIFLRLFFSSFDARLSCDTSCVVVFFCVFLVLPLEKKFSPFMVLAVRCMCVFFVFTSPLFIFKSDLRINFHFLLSFTYSISADFCYFAPRSQSVFSICVCVFEPNERNIFCRLCIPIPRQRDQDEIIMWKLKRTTHAFTCCIFSLKNWRRKMSK